MKGQAEKGRIFRELHERAGTFVIPNPWDIGTARLLARTGFEALATTSIGYAFSVGRQDHGMKDDGTFGFVNGPVTSREISDLLGDSSG